MDRFLERYQSKFRIFTDWIYLLVVINLIALLMSALGLVVFGLFPAMMTTYHLIKRSIQKEEYPIFKTFWQTFKAYFIKANVLGYLLVAIWTVIVLSWLFYLEDLSTPLHWVGLFIMGTLAMLTFLVTTYVPISFVYFPNFKVFEHLKFSLLMAIGMPKASIVIALNTLFFYGFIMIRLITVFPFLAFSLPALVNLWVARQKLLNIFTFFKDEHVKAMSMNAMPSTLELWTFYQEHLEGLWPLTYEAFMDKGIKSPWIDKRLSMVLMDKSETIIGFLIVFKDGLSIHLMMLYIDEPYRKRGYGKRMIKALEEKAYVYGYEDVKFGHPEGYYEHLPRVFSRYLPWLKKQGYEIEETESGYEIHKNIEVKRS